jgi:hypothetical protein
MLAESLLVGSLLAGSLLAESLLAGSLLAESLLAESWALQNGASKYCAILGLATAEHKQLIRDVGILIENF